MSYAYTLDEPAGLVRVVWTGDVTPDVAAEAILAVASDPRVRPGFSRLVDMRQARLQIPKHENRELATAKANASPALERATRNGRTAIVVADELSFGVASQYAAYSELRGFPTEVFRDLPSAEKWLAAGRSVEARV